MRITEAQNGGYWPGNPEEIPEYDYEYTELDNMPDGWRIAFGEEMCEEIRNALIESGGEKLLNEYRVTQIKEKYGELRWYDDWTTEKVSQIIDKYTKASRHICIECGEPAVYFSTGWISPWCEECSKHINDRMVRIGEGESQ